MSKPIIRVLVVDDSAVAREILTHAFSLDPVFKVIGTANNGEDAVSTAQRERPDIITMDIHMPKLDGFEATRSIMETCPTPIVIVTGAGAHHEVATTFRAVEAGALTVLARPAGIDNPNHDSEIKELLQTIKLMSEVKVVRRWPRQRREVPATSPLNLRQLNYVSTAEIKLVAIGASTGGPTALLALLSGLPQPFPVPIVIVQHMAAGFTQGFAEWLSQAAGRPVQVATHGTQPAPGQVYVAPDGWQIKCTRGGTLALTKDEPENNLRPSVSYFFRSVAQVYGASVLGVLLTGMGKDGAPELKMMREAGAITLAQDEASSVVFGMPGEAVRLEAATYVLSPEKMAAAIKMLVMPNGV